MILMFLPVEGSLVAAVQSDPDNPIYLDLLGKAYLINKEFDKALIQLRQAIDISPASWRILAKLGETNMQMDNFTEALIYMQDAHKLKPGNPIVLSNPGCWH